MTGSGRKRGSISSFAPRSGQPTVGGVRRRRLKRRLVLAGVFTVVLLAISAALPHFLHLKVANVDGITPVSITLILLSILALGLSIGTRTSRGCSLRKKGIKYSAGNATKIKPMPSERSQSSGELKNEKNKEELWKWPRY